MDGQDEAEMLVVVHLVHLGGAGDQVVLAREVGGEGLRVPVNQGDRALAENAGNKGDNHLWRYLFFDWRLLRKSL